MISRSTGLRVRRSGARQAAHGELKPQPELIAALTGDAHDLDPDLAGNHRDLAASLIVASSSICV